MSEYEKPLALNPWHPTTNTIDLKHLGKAIEEANELGSALARCVIQGVDESEPVTGKPNKLWLTEEVADVLACAELLTERFALDREFIERRKQKKMKHLKAWHYLA